MAEGMSIKVHGLTELLATMTPEQIGPPLRDFMTSSTITVENLARKNAPVDTGRLVNSITHKIHQSTVPLWVRVGTNVSYAPYIEFGTGLLTDGEGGSGRWYFPPPQALERWAQRHGFGEGGGYIVARSIWRKGGLKPRRFLRNALSESLDIINMFAQFLGREIADRLGGTP